MKGPVMRRTRIGLLKLMPLLVLFVSVAVHAEGSGDYGYRNNGDGTCTIIYYIGPGGDVTIPDTLAGLTVIFIRERAFQDNDNISSVTISNSVTTIGDSAFDRCTKLTNVTIGNSVTTIGDFAFYRCTKLTNVTIANSVTSIGYRAFSRCNGLIAITVDVLNPNYSSADGALFNKTQTTLIQCPGGKTGAYTIPNSVTSIGESAFSYCDRLISVTIPDSVTSIGDYAFYFCDGLTSVLISDSVTTLGNSAFSRCTSLTGIYFKGDAPALGTNVFDAVGAGATVYYLSETIGWGATYGGLPTALWMNDQYTWVNNGDGTCTISTGPGGDAVIPDTLDGLTVAAISKWAFYEDQTLTGITIPDSVTSIVTRAFLNCGSLMSVTIGNGVTRINPEAFFNCNNLTSFTVDAANPVYSSVDGVLFNKDQTELIQYPGKKAGAYLLPDTVTRIRGFAFWNCTDLTGVEIPDSVTTIGESAFGGCDGLASVTLGSGVSAVSGYAFMDCNDLASITIPDGITSIREGTFLSCDSLASITIPDSVTTVWERAYSDCTSLTSVSIPDSVTGIGDEAFYSCQTLNDVIVGDGVTNIDSYVFDNCSRLTGLYFKGNAPTLDASVNGAASATVYYLPWTSGWGATYGSLPTAEWPLAPADIDIDGYVNLTDFASFAEKWLRAGCSGADNWCGRTDFDQSTDVGPLDLDVLATYWLDVSIWTPSPADVDINGEVDLTDFSILAAHWDQIGCDASNDWCGWSDFDQSGEVDVADLTLLGDDWLYGTAP